MLDVEVGGTGVEGRVGREGGLMDGSGGLDGWNSEGNAIE